MHVCRLLIALCAAVAVESANAGGGALRAVPFTQVELRDGFWAPRVKTTIERTLPHCLRYCEVETGRVRNWERAAGKRDGAYEGYFFDDSDVFKVIEGAAYVLHHTRDAELDRHLDELIAKIAAMQLPDGYVNSYYTVNKAEKRWSDIEHRHELYCAGHLLEAAVAHAQIAGKRTLLDVALRLADHVAETFGPTGNPNPCGHPEIELALIRLADALRAGVPRAGVDADPARAARYEALARFFIDAHGRTERRERLWGEYALDHRPLAEQDQIAGHSVRAMYLLSAATDLARAQPETGYATPLDRLWRDLTTSKMYVTGGIGSSARNEGFTRAYDLPNDAAYAETCAAIGMLLWNHRMSLLHADSRYVDVLERALYNGVLAGVSLDGTAFHYVNPLASRGQHRRTPWFACACCPPNVVRVLPTVGGYLYSQTDNAIYVNLYAESDATITLRRTESDATTPADVPVRVTQKTDYPWDGVVSVTIQPTTPLNFEIHFRIPAWCEGAKLRIGGETIDADARDNGYVAVSGDWTAQPETFELTFPMPSTRVSADPRVAADLGRVALQRGPLVYCLEACDNAGTARNLALPPDAPVEAQRRAGLLGGVVVLTSSAIVARDPGDDERLYRARGIAERRDITAIPYYAWNNREPGEMVVWIPESPQLVLHGPAPGVTPAASHCWSGDTVLALCDRIEPASSADHEIPRMTWWPRKGSAESVEYAFDKPRAVSFVDVYWFDDRSVGGGCRLPASWRVLARVAGEWKPVVATASQPAAVVPDRYNRIAFEPVITDGLRLDVQLAEGASAGILEWRFGAE